MTHEPLYKVEKLTNRSWGVYRRDFGSSGGWVYLKAFPTEKEANEYIYIYERECS